jgi:HlyD family secretion protein
MISEGIVCIHWNRNSLVMLAVGSALASAGCARHPVDTYQGYIEGKFVYVASSQSGRLIHLAVERGDTVALGRSLFDLDNEPEASAARQAQRLLRSSESRLADVQTGKRPQEIEVTRAQLLQALAEKKQATDLFASEQEQYRTGGIPQTDLIKAQSTLDESAAKVQELDAHLAVDTLPAREQQIRAQREQVAADRAALAEAEWRLQQKEISSPRRGLVFDTLYREGEWVSAGNPVVELLPPENVEIRFFVPETVVGKLHVDQSISVACDGCSTKVQAQITFISQQNEYTPPVIYSNENRSKLVYMIIAKPHRDQAALLHPGQPVEVALP